MSTSWVVLRPAPPRAIPVVVGDGLTPGWGTELAPFADCQGIVMLVCDSRLPEAVRAPVEAELRALARDRLVSHPVSGGERCKSLDGAVALYRTFLTAGVHRDGLVVALGGGTVGDLVGFAASTWHRGVPWAVLPTTLLAQVDSCLGGKVGINLEGLKNQVGAFHHPAAVVADVAWLASLPPEPFLSGLGEVVKYALGFDPYLWELLVEHEGPVTPANRPLIAMIVRRCLSLKARIVAFDERDTGQRHLLNLGHTFAHVLEGTGACATHGLAVALGLLAATRLAVRLSLCDADVEGALVGLLTKLGLPTSLRCRARLVDEAWRADKKHRLAHTRVVLPTRVGACRIVEDPPEGLVREVMASLTEER